MGSGHRISRLSREIASIFRRSSLAGRLTELQNTTGTDTVSAGTRSLVYSSVMLLTIAPAQVGAVALGELQVRSALGEPLRATVPMQAGRGELLSQNCITAPRRPSELNGAKDLEVHVPAVTQAGIYEVSLTTGRPLTEPVYEIALQVDCPGTPMLLREYVLMLDLPGMMLIPGPLTRHEETRNENSLPEAATVPAGFGQNLPIQRAPRRDDRALAPSNGDIEAGSVYRVREADNLSTIAHRVDGRPANSTWQIANLIFQMNPGAFIRGNPDLIKLGYEIRIPDTPDWAGPVTALTPAPVAMPSQPVTPVSRAPMPAMKPENDALATPPAPDPVTIVDRYEPVATDGPVTMPETVVTEGPVTDESETLAVIDPFIDEQIDVAVDVTADIEPAPVAVSTPDVEPAISPAIDRAPQSRAIGPLTAIFVGVLLGLVLSVLLLRTRLLETLHGLLGRTESVKGAPEGTLFGNTDEMFKTDPALKTAASGDGIPAIPVKHTKPRDYVVETGDPDSGAAAESIVVDEPDAASGDDEPAAAAPADLATDISTDISTDTPAGDDATLAVKPDFGTNLESSDETLLDKLFADNDEAAPTEEVPVAVQDIFAETSVDGDPTQETDDAPTGPTDELEFEPTADLPQDISAQAENDPTAEMPAAVSDDSSLAAAIDELPDLPEDDTELFDVGDDDDSALVDLNLTQMSDVAEDEDDLSDAFEATMSLLEQDYEDELSASQIFERAEIEKAMEEGDDEDTENVEKLDS